MADDGIQRSLGRIEATLEAHGQDITSIKTWQVEHESGHHGLHGRGPGGIINRQMAQTTGVAGIVVLIVEALLKWWPL